MMFMTPDNLNQQGQIADQDKSALASLINYELSEADYAFEESRIVASIEAQTTKPDIYTVWLHPEHPGANLVRTEEAREFKEMPELMAPFEEGCMFLALFDTREGAKRMVYGSRLSWPDFGESENVSNDDPLNIAFLKGVIESEQGVITEDVAEYYTAQGVKLSECVSVESIFDAGDQVKTGYEGLTVANLSYIEMYAALSKRNNPDGMVGIFAHMNRASLYSLGRMRAEIQPLVGREDLLTPTIGPGKFDKKYRPVFIPVNQRNVDVFEPLLPLAPQIVEV
jgi:hypothetical protein